jgi:uncharacterized membrane protein YkoI
MRHLLLNTSLLVLLASGCSEVAHEAEDAIPFDQVPAAALKAAQERAPGVKFENAWKETVAGKQVFELRGRTKEGKVREIEVTATGEVIDEE